MTDTDITPLYLHPHAGANQPVALYEGPVVLQCEKAAVNCSGKLALRWLPSTGLRLEMDILSGGTPRSGASVRADIAGAATDVLINATSVSISEGVPSTTAVGFVSSMDVGAPGDLTSIGFQIVNFHDFITPGPKPAPVFGFPPKTVELRSGGWRACLTAVQDSKTIFESLKETGGYAFTHLGRLDRIGGESFSAGDAELVLGTLASFLSFARGAACSLPIQWGVGAGEDVAWQRWCSPVVDPWRPRQGWFDEHHGNLLAELFPAFAQVHGDASLGRSFELALHWYLKCNTRAGGMEGAIILGLTALDLLGALVLVEKGSAMSASKYDALPAKSKLAELLKVLNVPDVFPNRVQDLRLFADANGWANTAIALAEIRHG